jgi:thiol-disulfide isomerase/thioredoxin
MRYSDHLMTRRLLIAGAACLAAVAAALALHRYGTEFLNNRPDRQPIAAPSVTDGAGFISSDSLGFSFLDEPRALSEIRFADGEGRDLSLGDFRERPILLNIWATWCIPCRKEMPALDRLQAKLGEAQLLVLALSIDRQGAPVVKQFYQELGLKALGVYVDQSGKAPRDLNTVGVPTTLLIDRDGREIGRKIGAAEWDSPESIALIRQHLEPHPSGPGDKGR